jgi:hypothetical protein
MHVWTRVGHDPGTAGAKAQGGYLSSQSAACPWHAGQGLEINTESTEDTEMR